MSVRAKHIASAALGPWLAEVGHRVKYRGEDLSSREGVMWSRA